MALGTPRNPGVSYVMPVLNEAGYIENAVNTVLGQDYDGDQELILALGPSTDATDEIVAQLTARDPRIVCVHNPNTDIPYGLNLAIKRAKHPVIVRVDAHSELEPGYTTRAVQTLQRTGAANVGGLMKARGKTRFQTATARAYNSRFGLGGAAYHDGAAEGPAESAYLGVFRREVLTEVDYYDESLRRGEDWELNLRIRAAGHQVWFDPALVVTYWPRESWTKLVRQFIATGAWRGELVRRYAARNPWRFFAPPVLTVAVLLSIVAIILQLTGVLTGWLALVAWLVYSGPIAYLIFLIVVALTADHSAAWRDRLLFLLVLPTMHLSWGLGFLIGVVRGARDVSDTSRTDN
ncbi:MAG: glycosyltransferase family 2 protein [Terrimesophilobacter sp.]